MNRRSFLQHGAAAAFAIWSASRTRAQTAEAVLNLSSQESRVPGATLKEKVANLVAWGANGIELHGNPKGRIAEIREALAGTPVKVSALCWGSHKGDLVSTDADRRRKGIEALRDALSTAGELGARGVIFVPCFHKESELPPAELDKILLDILPALGEHAVKCNTRVLLEPLNKGETFYLNRVEQAAELCRKVNSPGIALMADFYHMSREETDQCAAIVAGGPWLHHVHIATGKSRILPGQEEHSFVEGMRGLRKIGYVGFCSLECGIRKGTDPMVEVPRAFETLREQWKLSAL
ncbi:MAG: sugar phosphate isomerase/epimerase [Kiritimatiellae bacterium]|nr:sugar phosphate isomerase/epimerase [Kiritimatiellia bacterium]